MPNNRRRKERSNTLTRNESYVEKEVKNEVLEGYVVKRFSNNDKYEGYYINGKRNGKGTYIWASGDKYTGQWIDGLFQGFGLLELSTGDSFKGNFSKGQAHGMGVKNYGKTGIRIEGEFICGEANGFCSKLFRNGDVYVGYLKNGCMHNYGEYTWSSGDKYMGTWFDDQMEGIGTKVLSIETINSQKQQGITEIIVNFDGNFHKNLFSEFGIATYENGSTYTGNWERGERHGWGKLSTNENGLVYHGHFIRGSYHGRGTLKKVIEENDDVILDENSFQVTSIIQNYGGEYNGEFKNGKANGVGVFTLGSRKIKGFFINDRLDRPLGE